MKQLCLLQDPLSEFKGKKDFIQKKASYHIAEYIFSFIKEKIYFQ